MCQTTIPMCWKCSEAEVASIEPGVTEFVGCKEQPGITNYAEAQKNCPLIEPEPAVQYEVEETENPCPDTWPGKWYRFRVVGGSEWGKAHESKLHLYIGKEQCPAS